MGPAGRAGIPDRGPGGRAAADGAERALKIAVTADPHFDLRARCEPGEFLALRAAVFAARPDVFIVAGDLVGLGKIHLPAFFDLFADLPALKLAVPGNHDLWLPAGDSYRYYREDLPEISRRHGFRLLDAEPAILDGVGFVGSVGWYDYTLADETLELPAGASYEAKRCGGGRWNDAAFVRLGKSDREFTDELLARLEEQLTQVEARVERVIAVTHHLAFPEMRAWRRDTPEYRFFAAYLGSRRFGEMLERHPRVRYHFSGHVHAPSRLTRGGLTAINVGSTYRAKRLEIVEV
ncbi:MAG: metallophosphoesterase [Planctomycetes bacterium]|nr:metallophosphoesterase [Planctomycetota bacterium]